MRGPAGALRRRTSPPMANQHDVARETGFSQATISRALRGDPRVTRDTRAAVLDACRRLGYRPSVGARMLVRGRAAVIGLSLSDGALRSDRYVSLLHQSLALELSNSGWGAALVTAEDFERQLGEVGALILVGVSARDPRIAACRAVGVPVVAIGYPADPTVARVVPDDADGVRQAILHLAGSAGRERLALVSSFEASGRDPGMRLRAEAAREAAAAAGTPLALEVQVRRHVSSALAGYLAVADAPDRFDGVDGVFCDTDEHAVGVIAALEAAGRSVPGEVSVVGFDDIPGFSAALTTVRQDFGALARAAVAFCLDAGDGSGTDPGDRPTSRTVPVRLVVRDT